MIEKQKLVLPEIKLGIHPGYGGTARSIERCGPLAAMNIMLTGRALTSRAAKKIGLIDEMVPLRQLKAAAEKYALTSPARKICTANGTDSESFFSSSNRCIANA